MPRTKRHSASNDTDVLRRARLYDPLITLRHPDATPTICERGHVWMARARSRKRTDRCPKCLAPNSSVPEQQLFLKINSVFPNALHRADVYYRGRPIEIDIYLPRLQVAIECDGPHHVSRVKTDQEKNYILSRMGIQLLRVRSTGLPELQPDETVTYSYDLALDGSLSRCFADIAHYLDTHCNLTDEERSNLHQAESGIQSR